MILPSESNNRVRRVTITHVAQQRLFDTVHRLLSTVHFRFALQLLMLIVVSGCATRPPGTPGGAANWLPPTIASTVSPAPSTSNLPPSTPASLSISAQYAFSTGTRVGFNTAEIYLQNVSTNTIVFKTASLNGRELIALETKKTPVVFKTINFDGEDIPLLQTEVTSDPDLTWWQFYPSPELPPGSAILCQLNFRKTPTAQQNLVLTDMAGKTYPVTVPRFRNPEKLITAVTWPQDLSRAYIQFQSRKIAPTRLWLNNWEVPFRFLPSSEPDTPDMLAVALPKSDPSNSLFLLSPGTPFHVKIQFADNDTRQALVRTLPGILLDSWFKDRPNSQALIELGLDPQPAAVLLPLDVTCQDVRLNDKGSSAMPVAAERLKSWRERKDTLSGLTYCTAMFPELWNIYGQLADAVYSKPYRLNWGHNDARSIEEEEDCIKNARDSARPRPFFWIPERFKRDRFIEPAEMRLIAWSTLMLGGKGIRYHFWKNEGPDPFAGCPLLLPALTNLNLEIRAHASTLAPLVPISERTIRHKAPTPSIQKSSSSSSNPKSAIQNPQFLFRLYTAFSGDQGLLLMVRNLDYQNDSKADDAGGAPRFQPNPQTGVPLSIALPAWFKCGQVTDYLSGNRLKAVKSEKQVDIRLDRLDAFTLVWLENRNATPKSWFEFWK